MTLFRVRNETRGEILAHHVERADTFWARTRGLLGRGKLPEGHGLWIERCRSIHTHFMRFSIDAVFVSDEGTVVRTYHTLPPFRMTACVRGSRDVLELPAGTLRRVRTEIGDRLALEARP